MDPTVGSVGIIGKAGGGAPCAATRDNLKAAYLAAASTDNGGFADALQGGAQLSRGDRVLVIDSAPGSGFNEGIDVRVRVLSGPNAHVECWARQDAMHLQPAR
jgi:hypothetical protein